MRDGFETRKTWPFECLRCLHVWEEEYVVRHLMDDYGNEVEIWLQSGVPVQPPWSGASCPGCGAYHVTSFPSGYLSRHPELMAAPEPEPVARPRPAPAPPAVERRAPAPRTPLPMRVLVAIGVPIVVFVAYELYEGLKTVAHPH
ncbi:hypothetical protein ABZ297_39265 [Nonomuraea sp. NPDC005983]|uniref:hypothetical protein n=1 Tax=Nonomuraea sp. NPDC005983 TaxID=3155595 RepID=UPI0033AE308B